MQYLFENFLYAKPYFTWFLAKIGIGYVLQAARLEVGLQIYLYRQKMYFKQKLQTDHSCKPTKTKIVNLHDCCEIRIQMRLKS